MKKLFLLLSPALLLVGCYPSNVLDKITDPEFQKAVMKFDNNGDHQISREEALMVKELYNPSKAENFDGIEYFENLEKFDVDHNDDVLCQSLDLSKNKNLKTVCLRWYEDLKTLKLPENIEGLYITRIGIGKLELGEMPWLKAIYLEGTNIENIDLSKFKSLEQFTSIDNKIKSLNISENPNLRDLRCKGTKELIMKQGQTIDGVTHNPDYKYSIDEDITIKYIN